MSVLIVVPGSKAFQAVRNMWTITSKKKTNKLRKLKKKGKEKKCKEEDRGNSLKLDRCTS